MTDNNDNRTDARRFYTSALTRAEKMELPSAMSLEGIDGEIALLRIRLRRLAGEKPDEFALLLRGIGMLAKSPLLQVQALLRIDGGTGEGDAVHRGGAIAGNCGGESQCRLKR